MDQQLAQEAISLALSGNWKEAISVNQKILKLNSKDLGTLNRLARAYAELGQITKARKTAQKVIKIDSFNTIADKSLKKWKGLKDGEVPSLKPSGVEAFLEEPGKTKMLTLIHLGSPNVLAKLDSADEVKLDFHCHRISVVTLDGKYVGRLPDDISSRLKRLAQLGNEYLALVKSVEREDAKIFIREVKKGKGAKDIVSFPGEKVDYISFASPKLVRKPEIAEFLDKSSEE